MYHFVRDVCDGLCGERHQEDSPIDNMALFGGAHIRKGSGTIMLLYPKHINKHASIICMYIYYIWELSIFRDIKVCGFHSACIYTMVIARWSDICDIDIWATSI